MGGRRQNRLWSGVERRGEGCPLEQEALQQAGSSMAITYIIKHCDQPAHMDSICSASSKIGLSHTGCMGDMMGCQGLPPVVRYGPVAGVVDI